METVATFDTPEQAHLLRMCLASAGVSVFVFDEHLVQLFPFGSHMIGGVRVQVHGDDYDDVCEFLQLDGGLPEQPDHRCPECGWAGVEREWFSKRFAYLTLVILGFPVPVFRYRYRCNRCLYTWGPSELMG